MPPPGLPRAADPARGGAVRAAALAGAPVLGAARTCAAAARSTRTASGSAGTRPAGPVRYRRATPMWTDATLPALAGAVRRRLRARRGAQRDRRHAGDRDRRARRSPPAVAVQPQRRRARLARLDGQAGRDAAGHRPAHPGGADRLGAAVGAGPRPAARRAPAAEAVASVVAEVERGRARLPAQPAAHRRHVDRRDDRRRTPCPYAADARRVSWSAPNRSTTTRPGAPVPDRTPAASPTPAGLTLTPLGDA